MPHDPTRPCRPEGGFGLVMMMVEHAQKVEVLKEGTTSFMELSTRTFKSKMTGIIFGAHYPGDCIARRRWVMSEKAMVTSLF